MKVRSIVALAVILLVTAFCGYVALNGVAWGIYEIRPLAEQIPKGLDLTGGVSVVYEPVDTSIDDLAAQLDTVETIMRTRLDSEGYPEATINRQGANRIRIEIPINESNAIDDPSEITQYLIRPAKIEFRDPDGNVVCTGSDMESTDVAMNPNNTGDYVVMFELNAAAASAFAQATAAVAGTANNFIAIYMDDELISAPRVETAITGTEGAYIEGGFAYEEALRLTQQIQSGALPIEMEEIEARSVSATLGEDALDRGIMAGAIGICLVFVFMAVYYRLPGLMADLALIIYMILVLFCLATIEGVQLTLPGIAGIILSIGMAVDANVIIFERMREDLASGKSVRTSVRSGFQRAFSAIMDSNITTVIAAVVLLLFGTGSIKGFAVTLLIGIIVSFFTAVLVTRGLMHILVGLHIENRALFCPMKKLRQPGGAA